MITCQSIISLDQGKSFAVEHSAFRPARDEDTGVPADVAVERSRVALWPLLAHLLETSAGFVAFHGRMTIRQK